MKRRLERANLSEQVATAVIEAVIEGKYATGSLLPSEPELARIFGVSRPVIREAVRILATKGIVRSEHGRGVVVLEHNSRPLLDNLTLSAWRLRVPAHELWETRQVIDVALAEMATLRRTEADLALMRAAVAQMKRHLEAEGTHDVEADAEFHKALAGAAHNAFIAALAEPLAQLYRAAARAFDVRSRGQAMLGGLAMHEWLERACAAHELIYERIADGDVTGTQRALREHWDLSYAMWHPHLRTTMDDLIDSWPPLSGETPSEQRMPHVAVDSALEVRTTS